MRLNHIALNILNKEELVDFYQNILGFELEYQFVLNDSLANQIFDMAQQSEVFRCKNETLSLELFVFSEKTLVGFAHICLEMKDREAIAQKSRHAGYPVTKIPRSNKPDILFIRDKAGNIFELKTSAPK